MVGGLGHWVRAGVVLVGVILVGVILVGVVLVGVVLATLALASLLFARVVLATLVLAKAVHVAGLLRMVCHAFHGVRLVWRDVLWSWIIVLQCLYHLHHEHNSSLKRHRW